MTKEEILNGIKKKFGNRIKNINDKSYKRVYIEIDPKDIIDFVRHIFCEQAARFNTASCIDMRDKFEILYHFTIEEACLVLSIRVFLDKERPEIESLTPIMKGAEWIEREIHELFGVDFKNHPNIRKLLLPDDWPEHLHPLKRDYKEEDYQKCMLKKEGRNES